MNLLQQLKMFWTKPEEPSGIVIPNGSVEPSEPFIVFPCHECQTPITVQEYLYPGQVAVIDCPNCSTSMTVYNPHLEIYRTKQLPSYLQKPVWEKLAL